MIREREKEKERGKKREKEKLKRNILSRNINKGCPNLACDSSFFWSLSRCFGSTQLSLASPTRYFLLASSPKYCCPSSWNARAHTHIHTHTSYFLASFYSSCKSRLQWRSGLVFRWRRFALCCAPIVLRSDANHRILPIAMKALSEVGFTIDWGHRCILVFLPSV